VAVRRRPEERRRRPDRRKRPPSDVVRVVALAALDTGGGGDVDLRAAAELIADDAKDLAGSWSRKIPPTIETSIDGLVATVSASAPNARPAELRLRHPLFRDRHHWYGPPGEPFLAPAADARANAAMARYAQKIDRWAREAGFH